ncbi:MAG: hydantoinase/oxoprolinase family protein, partial [Chloroflexi bacterium]|nr:hydantoinase/oxoprolinase family protein [Chloroflexota bacterium]
MTLRIGIDTGGTFTDLVAVREETGEIFTSKKLSTPSNPAVAFLQVIGDVRQKDGGAISSLIHGTTVATNCLLERKGASVLYATTQGFEDVPYIQRIWRKSHYDLQWEKPKPLVKRRNSVGVRERIDYEGQPITPLTAEELASATDRIVQLVKENNIETIAVCFLFSYI